MQLLWTKSRSGSKCNENGHDVGEEIYPRTCGPGNNPANEIYVSSDLNSIFQSSDFWLLRRRLIFLLQHHPRHGVPSSSSQRRRRCNDMVCTARVYVFLCALLLLLIHSGPQDDSHLASTFGKTFCVTDLHLYPSKYKKERDGWRQRKTHAQHHPGHPAQPLFIKHIFCQSEDGWMDGWMEVEEEGKGNAAV